MKKHLLSKLFYAVLIVMMAFPALPVTSAYAADTGAKLPTANTNAGWTNPQNAYDAGTNQRTSSANNGNTVDYRTFNFGVPAGSVIDGIVVSVEGYSSGTRNMDISLSWDNGGNYTPAQNMNFTNFQAVDETLALGNATDTWGRTWTSNDFANGNFRVRLQTTGFGGGLGTVNVDNLWVTVYYHAPATFTINASASAGGSISPSGAVAVTEATNQTFTITPASTYIVQDVLVDAASQGRANSYTFTNVAANHTISASFDGGWAAPTQNSNNSFNAGVGNAYASDNAYAVANGGGQSARYYGFGLSIPAGDTIDGIQVALEGNRTNGRDFTVDLTWNNNNFSTAITQSTSFTGTDSTVILGSSSTTSVWGGHAWTATELNSNNFRVRVTSTNGGGNISLDQLQIKVYHHTPVPHTITATAGAGGTITPSGAIVFADGANQAFDITPNSSYIVSDVVVDAASQGRQNSYTFTNIIADHTIAASFDGGWYAPSANSGGGWANEGNAYVSDNTVATGGFNNTTTFSNFNITIPSGAVIDGIEVAAEGSTTSRDITVALSGDGGGTFTTARTINFTTNAPEETILSGNSSDLWGLTWSGTSFSNANFRMIVATTGGGGTFSLDQIQVKVYYHVLNNPPTGADNTITFNEDAAYTFAASDFGFSDSDAGDSMSAVRIDTLPAVGNLTLSGNPVAANDVIPTASIPNLVFTPAANANGNVYASFNFSVRDTNGSTYDTTPNTITFNVAAVNDAPSYGVSGLIPAVNEDTGAVSVPGWIAVFNPGPAEVGQTVLNWIVSNSTCGTLLSTGPSVTGNTLSYTTGANQNGTCTFDLQVQDNGGIANGGVDTSISTNFTITVNSVNDAPSITASNPPAVSLNAPAQTVNNWAVFNPGGGADEAGQSALQYIVSNTGSCSTLLSAGPVVDTSGTLTYTPAANQTGSCTFDVQVQDDGGTANGGVDTSAVQTYTIAIDQATQTINVITPAPASASNGSTFDVEATATSGLPVTITTSGVCTGGDTDGTATITMTSGTGTCSVFYDQAGDSNYQAAPQVQEDVNATDAPAFTSTNNASFDLGFSGTFNITATGNPSTMTISVTGTLPTGITFTDNGDGTASFDGTPTVGGVFNLILTADNGVTPNGIQNFTLTVRTGPTPDTINSNPDTGNGSLSENEIISSTLNITQLIVNFNRDVYDPAGDTDPEDVTNPANYILVRSATGTFNTLTCAAGVVAPDVPIAVDSVTYDNGGGSGPYVATLNINGGLPLNVDGFYRLFVCGTTSIVDATNTALHLAGDGVTPGTDFTRNFRIETAATGGGGGGGGGGHASATTTVTTSGALIPVTGFAPNLVTQLPAQEKAYAASKLVLEIPSLSLKMPIVGVSFKDNSWNVTWLGNNAGYLEGSAYPTWNGNTVLTGHVTDANGKPGAFAYLHELNAGDKVYIHNNGFIYVYEVRHTQVIKPTDIHTLFKHEDDAWVTLVTCENYNAKTEEFTGRRMVSAVLISILPEK